MSWIETYTGKRFHVLDPMPEEICIEDIAHALSMLCRFGGHCRVFYSVAKHSLVVADIVDSEYRGSLLCPDVSRAALMHDAAEAYVGDVCRPTKRVLPGFSQIEDKIQKAICQRFNIDTDSYGPIIKQADDQALLIEAAELMPSRGRGWDGFEGVPSMMRQLKFLSRAEVERKFLDRFYSLWPEEIK